MKPNKKIRMWVQKKLYPAIMMDIAHYKLVYAAHPESLLKLDDILLIFKRVTSVNDLRLVPVPRFHYLFMGHSSLSLGLKVLEPDLCGAIKEFKRLAKPHCTRDEYFGLVRDLNYFLDYDDFYHSVKVDNDDDSDSPF